MSLEAMAWVLNDAPGLPANAFGTLMGLANHADHQGRGAFIAQATLGKYARKTDRQVRRDLSELESLGLIRRGDQRLVAHYKADKRPIVWDLAVELREPVDTDRTPATGRGSPAGRARPVADDRPDADDRTYTVERPDVHVRQTVIEPTTTARSAHAPSPPDPKPPSPRRKGTRLPDEFRVTPEMRAWFDANISEHVDGKRETEKFRNYWAAKTGQTATKLDWEATWRNWMIKAGEYR